MCKILLILTCAIKMMNETEMGPGIRDQNVPTIVCICHFCLRSQCSVLVRKIPATVYGK